MKQLWRRFDCAEMAEKQKGSFPHPENAVETVDQDTTVVGTDGNIAAVYLRNAIPKHLHLRAFALLNDVKGLITNRPHAVGTEPLPRSVNKDGAPSPRIGVNKVVADLDLNQPRQGILGWDRPNHLTTLTREHPEMLDGNRELIELVDHLYAKHLPLSYKSQNAMLKGKCDRLWSTAFTTAYVPKNFRTAYHRDGNMKGAMTAITPLGKFSGGERALGTNDQERHAGS